jgi:hypothetical protein
LADGLVSNPMINAALGSRCDETMSLRDAEVSSRPRVIIEKIQIPEIRMLFWWFPHAPSLETKKVGLKPGRDELRVLDLATGLG